MRRSELAVLGTIAGMACFLAGAFATHDRLLGPAFTSQIDDVKPIEECAMSWSEARSEDELCALWFEGDELVLGPLWLKD